MIRYARLPLAFDAEAAKIELLLYHKEWQHHFNTYCYEGLWTVLSLRSPNGESQNIIPDLMSKSSYSNTEHMQRFPSVNELIGRLCCPVMAVRFLNLHAGAVIKEHTDKELALEKGEARLHFPVITNPDVQFYIENERVPMQAGECWYLNANLPHRVLNEGTTNRIHLVVDCKVNTWLTDIVNQSEEISFQTPATDSNVPNIIKELRLQNTKKSNRLAAELEQQMVR